MNLFLPCPHCDPLELSAALWLLSLPASVRQARDSRYLFDVVTGLDESRWLVVDDERMINIHPEALPQGELPQALAEIVTRYVEAGDLPAGAAADLKAKVVAALGTRILAATLLPEELGAAVKNLDEMIAAGTLAKPEGMIS